HRQPRRSGNRPQRNASQPARPGREHKEPVGNSKFSLFLRVDLSTQCHLANVPGFDQPAEIILPPQENERVNLVPFQPPVHPGQRTTMRFSLPFSQLTELRQRSEREGEQCTCFLPEKSLCFAYAYEHAQMCAPFRF